MINIDNSIQCVSIFVGCRFLNMNSWIWRKGYFLMFLTCFYTIPRESKLPHTDESCTWPRFEQPNECRDETRLFWVFPKIGGKPPKWMVKIMETLLKWMIWGYHYFWKHLYVGLNNQTHRARGCFGRLGYYINYAKCLLSLVSMRLFIPWKVPYWISLVQVSEN